MKFLEKYGVKKNLYYITLAVGALSLVAFLLTFSVSVDSYESAKSMLSLFVVLFYLYLIAKMIQVIISSFQYFYKKEKDKLILASFVLAVAGLVVALLNISMIRLINAIIAEDFMALLSLAGSVSNAEFMITLLKIMLIADAIFAGYIGYSLFVSKSLSFNSTTLTEEQNEKIQENMDKIKDDVDKMKESSFNGIQKCKAYLSTKKGKQYAIIAIVVVVFLIGFIIWNGNKKKEMDMFHGCELKVEGYDGNGSGWMSGCDIDYNINNSELSRFVHSIRYEIENNYDLSNGDEVKVTVKYSKETADDLKVYAKEDTKTFKVEGLKERYAKVKQIPKKILEQVDSLMREEAKWDKKDFYNIDDEFELTSAEVIQKIYFTDNHSESGNILYVYKVIAKGKEKNYFSEELKDITEVKYYTIHVDGIDEDFDIEDAVPNKYRIYDTEDLTDKEVIEKVIKESWHDNAEKF